MKCSSEISPLFFISCLLYFFFFSLFLSIFFSSFFNEIRITDISLVLKTFFVQLRRQVCLGVRAAPSHIAHFENRTSSWQTQLSRHFNVRFEWCAGSAVARGRRRQKLKRKKRNKKFGEISMAHFFAPFSTTIQRE